MTGHRQRFMRSNMATCSKQLTIGFRMKKQGMRFLISYPVFVLSLDNHEDRKDHWVSFCLTVEKFLQIINHAVAQFVLIKVVIF